MSMYDNADKDEIYYDIKRFLENHPISELLQIIADAVEVDE